MSVQLNHLIVYTPDKKASAEFVARILGLAPPTEFGPFLAVRTANDVTLDFASWDGELVTQHYAFLVSEQEFDDIFNRITGAELPYWADPFHRRPGAINTNDGGRGAYFEDPSGLNLEIITRPYGEETRAQA